MATNASGQLPRVPTALRVLLPATVFSAFLTGIKLVPGIGNNFGPFEIMIGILAGFAVLQTPFAKRPLFHPVTIMLLSILAYASFSQIFIAYTNRTFGLIQTGILLLMLLSTLILHNLIAHYRLSPAYLLRLITYSVVIVGLWIVNSGLSSAGSITAAGPFRNRAHMGTYMLTAFWLVLLFAQWPRTSKKDKLIAYVGLGFCLYSVAVSGRRSVYLSLFVGIGALAIAFLWAHKGKRFRVLVSTVFVALFLLVFYYQGHRFASRAEFFQRRVGMIGSRVQAAVTPAGQEETLQKNFFVLQREGVMHALRDRPIIGLGWGGFAGSAYSPTGHEVHSTPLRFLAEMGLPGFLLYLTLMGYIVGASVRTFFKMRKTPYGATYLVQIAALSSLCLSYAYNRHVTERTFWILLAVFLSLETFASGGIRWPSRDKRQGSHNKPRTRALNPAPTRIPLTGSRAIVGTRRQAWSGRHQIASGRSPEFTGHDREGPIRSDDKGP